MMVQKKIDLNQTVHALCSQHPELVEVLKQIGFTDITKPGMLATAGRFMTIPKGAALKKIDLNVVIGLLQQHGYSVEEGGENESRDQ